MNCHPFLVPAQRDSVGVVSDYGDPAAAQDNEAEAPTWQRVGEVAAELADIVYVIQLEPDFGFEYVSDSVTSSSSRCGARPEFFSARRTCWMMS